MSTTTFDQINRSCINNSSSKQLYRFSTSKRFCYNKQALTSHTDFLPSSYSQNKIRPLSFSKSKKQLVFQNEQQYKSHPSPDLYSQRSLKQFKSGISFALKLKPFYYQSNQKAPGPTSYSVRSFDRNNKSVSFSKQRRQLKYPKDNLRGIDSPGPGPYLIETQKLKSILSNYKNVKQTKIINKKVNNLDFSKIRMKMKDHQLKIRQKLQKKYETTRVVSTLENSLLYKKQKMTIFDKQVKKSIFDIKDKNPSPANYQSFSQFAFRNKPDMRKSSKKLQASLNSKDELRRRTKTLPVASQKQEVKLAAKKMQ